MWEESIWATFSLSANMCCCFSNHWANYLMSTFECIFPVEFSRHSRRSYTSGHAPLFTSDRLTQHLSLEASSATLAAGKDPPSITTKSMSFVSSVFPPDRRDTSPVFSQPRKSTCSCTIRFFFFVWSDFSSYSFFLHFAEALRTQNSYGFLL
jgi:hypothetical protein